MKTHEELVEEYENAQFALLMEMVALFEGEELLKENERLSNDPSAAVPKGLDERCLKTINRAIAKRRRRKIASIAYRIFQKATLAFCVVLLLFSAVYVASPQVRTATLNFLIENSGIPADEIGTQKYGSP